MKLRFLLFAYFILGGCAQTSTLNLKPHKFGQKAGKIIWLQVAGLSEEHLAMLRFSYSDLSKKTAFEKFQCSGQTWNFNLYQLRPTPYDSFLSQLIGSKNVKSDCSDYKNRPIWDYLESNGYQIGVFESGIDGESSLLKASSCEEEKGFLEDVTFWAMQPGRGEYFHYQGREPFESGKIYFDKSCQGKACYSSLFNNIKSVWERYRKDRSKILFLLRDFSYYKALKKKNITTSREILAELNKVLGYFQALHEKGEDVLILLTAAQSQRFELPKRGKEWAEFEKKGKHVLFRKPSLLSPVWALGPGSENFCGIYEESEIMKRTLWLPEGRTNPFFPAL